MSRPCLLFVLLLFFTINGLAQIRVGKLVIRPNEVFEIGQSDILVADTLIMMDSSKIRLNNLKRENFIRAEVAFIGSECVIEGRGVSGVNGKDGQDGDTPFGPCRDGTDARNGGKGLDGGHGNQLFLYFEELNLSGKLYIDLSGGNGGNGGNGGTGGGGSPGTVHCRGGDGGDGGDGGTGGDGGNGGTLTVNCLKCPDVRAMANKYIVLRSSGGHFGLGGTAGYAGAPGLAPNKGGGKKGLRGSDGANGKPGEKGILNFEVD